MRNPYEVLGLPRTATQAEIKKKYRNLAKDNHPDRHPGDAKAVERFKEINAAYGIVGDAKQRARFDRGEIDSDGRERVHAGFQQGAPRGFSPEGFGFPGQGGPRSRAGAGPIPPGGEGPFDPNAGGFGFSFDDLFSPLFGGAREAGGAKRGRGRGPDAATEMEIGFLESVNGATRRVQVDGRSLDVAIPAGIETGQTVRLRGQAQSPSGVGDVLITVRVAPHPTFRREGDDIHLDLPVTLGEALQGAKIAVPTIHGSVTLGIPAGSNSGSTLRLKEQGVRRKGKDAGNQYVHLVVALPEAVDPELAEFVGRWSAAHPYDPRRKLRS